MTDTIHARRIRILKESEETLGKHVESRDNTTILEFLDNVNDIENRVHLFQSAVLKLTCNNDEDTLGAVLDYGKEKKLDVQWITVEEGKEKNPDFQWMRDEGRRNPIIVASEQASIIYRSEFIIANAFLGLPSVHETALQVWLPDSPSSIHLSHRSGWGAGKSSLRSGDTEPRAGRSGQMRQNMIFPSSN